MHHWAFNGNANDSVGTNNGTISGATFSSAYYGGGANFDGGDFIDVGTVALGNTFTLSMRVWINANASNIQTLLANSASGATSNGFRLFVNTANTSNRAVLFETGNGTVGNGAATAAGAIVPNAWNHLAVTIDRSTGAAAIWVNGINATSDGTIRTDFATSANTDFGQMTNGGSRLNGRLDQVRIYNRVLTAAEVSQLASE
jgi:hypothetical protein